MPLIEIRNADTEAAATEGGGRVHAAVFVWRWDEDSGVRLHSIVAEHELAPGESVTLPLGPGDTLDVAEVLVQADDPADGEAA